jgi:hypothetical protein
MKGKIISITEVVKELKTHWELTYEGFIVIVDKGGYKDEYFVGIQSGQCCCETFGYLMSE